MFSQLWHWLSFIGGHFKRAQSQDAHQSVQRESESDQKIQTESEWDQSEVSLIENQSEANFIQIKVKPHASFTQAPEFNMVAEQCHLQGQGCQPGVTRPRSRHGSLTQHQGFTSTNIQR
eukprot:6103342-Amphidinium_carterae.1